MKTILMNVYGRSITTAFFTMLTISIAFAQQVETLNEQPDEAKTVHGVLKSINENLKNFSIKDDTGHETTFIYDKQTRVFFKDQKLTPASLAENMKITVIYQERKGKAESFGTPIFLIANYIRLESPPEKITFQRQRFVENGDGTVTDMKKHLMWQEKDDGIKRTYKEALAYAKTLTLGGHRDWRLPNPEEGNPETVVQLMQKKRSDGRADWFWTGDFKVWMPFNYPANLMVISNSHADDPKEDDKTYVRCVRNIR